MQSAPWDDARQRGVDFRAIGQEPGWLLEIDQGKSMYLLADYGERKVTVPTPTPQRDSTGTITYDTTAEGHHLTAVIRTRVCHDAMSGEEFTHEVTVTLDGKEYRGCGRVLEA
jgi:putative lipoprotein